MRTAKMNSFLIASILLLLALGAPLLAQTQWERIVPTLPSGGPAAYWMQEYDDGIYCSSYGAGMYHSTDDGLSWTPWATSLPNREVYRFLRTPSGRWITCSVGADMYYSDDNGVHWGTVNFTDPAIASLSSKRLVLQIKSSAILVGCSKNILRSTDNGTSWNKTNVPTFSSSVRNILQFSDNSLFASAGNVILQSTDDGQTWVKSSSTPGLAFGNIHQMGDVLYAATALDSVYTSVDKGLTWSSLNYDLPSTVHGMYEVCPRSSSLIIGTTEGGLWKLEFSTKQWTQVATHNQCVYMTLCIFETRKHTLLASDWYSYLRSSDAGDSWQSNNSVFDFSMISCVGKDSYNNVYLTSDSRDLYRYDGGGYQKILRVSDSLGFLSRAVTCDSTNEMFYTAKNHVYDVDLASTTHRQLTDLKVGTSEHLQMLFAVGTTQQPHPTLYALALISSNNGSDTDYYALYVSADGGNSWLKSAQRVPLSGMTPDAKMVVSSQGTIVVVSDSRAVRSTDDGSTWTLLPVAQISHCAADGMYIALAGPDSVYVSRDAFNTWTAYPLQLSDAISTMVLHRVGAGYLTSVVSVRGELVDFSNVTKLSVHHVADPLPFKGSQVNSLSCPQVVLLNNDGITRHYIIGTDGMGVYQLNKQDDVSDVNTDLDVVASLANPVPASEYVTLRLSGTPELRIIDNVGVDVSSLCGRAVATNEGLRLNIESFANGVYHAIGEKDGCKQVVSFVVCH